MKMKVKINDEIFDVEVGNIQCRPIPVEIQGRKFEVWPAEEKILCGPEPHAAPIAPTSPAPQNQSISQASSSAVSTSKQVRAPIPGVIVGISVKEEETVSYGQDLCVLEAMKMKNSIRSCREGVIARIFIASGEQVRQGKILMEFTEEG